MAPTSYFLSVFPLLPSPLQVVPFSFFWKKKVPVNACNEHPVLWRVFLKIQVLNPSSSSFTTVHLSFQPQRNIGTSGPHFPFFHQHMPKSCRGTKQGRIWDCSGAGCFSSASLEEHSAQPPRETDRTGKCWGHLDLHLGLSLLLCYL